jgi:hypothetical protein
LFRGLDGFRLSEIFALKRQLQIIPLTAMLCWHDERRGPLGYRDSPSTG